jgi:hypothetical protein
LSGLFGVFDPEATMSGELAGQLRPYLVDVAWKAKRRHRQILIVPAENVAEAAMWRALINVYGANSLSEVVQFLRGEKAMEPVRSANGWACAEPLNRTLISGSSRASSMSNALSKSPLPAVTIFSALDLFRRGLTPLC